MKIISEIELKDFEFWSGGEKWANDLDLSDEQYEQLESILEDMYPDGVDATTINDLFWFENDKIKEWLGISNWPKRYVLKPFVGEEVIVVCNDEDQEEDLFQLRKDYQAVDMEAGLAFYDEGSIHGGDYDLDINSPEEALWDEDNAEYVLKLPQWLVCAVANDDTEGLSDEEIEMYHRFIKEYQNDEYLPIAWDALTLDSPNASYPDTNIFPHLLTDCVIGRIYKNYKTEENGQKG